MQSYAEAYHRYFDSDRFAPGSPKTIQKELPRASAYEALVSLKKKYHGDSKMPLDESDLPTSAPLFDNDELLDRAEQVTTDWTHQHPGGATAAISPENVQDETRREAQNLWKIWTTNHVKQQQQHLTEPVQRAQEPRRASDSVAETAAAGGVGGAAGAGAVKSGILHDQKSNNTSNENTSHRGSSMPTASEMQSKTGGGRSMSLYDTDDGSKARQVNNNNDDNNASATKPTTAAAAGAGAGLGVGAVPAVACNTVPSNRSVLATAPIDNGAGQAKLPVASDRPVTEEDNMRQGDIPSNQKNEQSSGETSQSAMGKTAPSSGGGASGQPRGSREPADLRTENEARKEISSDNHHEAGKMAAATAAVGAGAAGAGASMAGPSSSSNAPVQQQQPQSSASSTPSQDQQRNVSFANESKDEQTKKEEVPSKNSGGTKDHIAEQSELYSQGGLSGTQPVGKIDLKNL